MCEAEERIIRVQHFAEALPEWSQGVLRRREATDAWVALTANATDKPTFTTAFEAVKALRYEIRARAKVAPDTGAAAGNDAVPSTTVGPGRSLSRPSMRGPVESKQDGTGAAIGAASTSGSTPHDSIDKDDGAGSEPSERRTTAQIAALERRAIALKKESRDMPSGHNDAGAAERMCPCRRLKIKRACPHRGVGLCTCRRTPQRKSSGPQAISSKGTRASLV